MEPLKLGLIGLGNMGTAIAERLLDAGYELVVYNRTPGKADALSARGAAVAKASADLVDQVDVVITSLSDDEALEAVAASVVAAARPGTARGGAPGGGAVGRVLGRAMASAGHPGQRPASALVGGRAGVDEGPTLRGLRPRAQGRGYGINKRTSHITVIVSDGGAGRAAAPERLASVASIFVSRVDTAVDKQLDTLGGAAAPALRGIIAIANAKAIYQRFRSRFDGAEFAALRARGVRVQRVLWGSTGTKDPAYSDVLYVEQLIGADTVNTLPPATLDAFMDHGRVEDTLPQALDVSQRQLAQLAQLGIDIDAVCQQLQEAGVKSFADAYEKLLEALEQKRAALRAN